MVPCFQSVAKFGFRCAYATHRFLAGDISLTGFWEQSDTAPNNKQCFCVTVSAHFAPRTFRT
jgi:hypothetical protein